MGHTLTVIGWSRTDRPDGVGVSSNEALDGAQSTWALVLRLSGARALSAVGADLVVARAFPRDVLFPSQP